MASLAELNVKQCKMVHDQCRSTDKYPTAGQNLAGAAKKSRFHTPQEMIENGIVAQWYANEIKKASESDMNKCCDNA